MNKKIIVANWKSNKTESEAIEWFKEFLVSLNRSTDQSAIKDKEIVICLPFTLLPVAKKFITENSLLIKLGSQDISPFDEGAYTGEVDGRQIKEFADYVIIGHSERRKNFSENDEILQKKIEMAKKYGLTSIFCVQSENDFIPNDANIIVYEPVFAIGTGNVDNPENIQKVLSGINQKTGKGLLLYGGSVDENNIKKLSEVSMVSGFLVGTASLDPKSFFNLLSKC